MGKVSLSLGQKRLVESQLKALTNEDTLLRTHGVSWAAQTGKHLLRTQNVSEQNQKHFLCPGHKICVRNKCCLCRQTGKHLCLQQCVRNNSCGYARLLPKITQWVIALGWDRLGFPARFSSQVTL